jgi:hypothetical protein
MRQPGGRDLRAQLLERLGVAGDTVKQVGHGV